jgi:hypothetical protein
MGAATPWISGVMYEVATRQEGPPPGATTSRVLSWLFPRRTYEQVFEPILADAEHEWVEAVFQNDKARRRRARLRCYVQLVQAAGLSNFAARLVCTAVEWTRGSLG